MLLRQRVEVGGAEQCQHLLLHLHVVRRRLEGGHGVRRQLARRLRGGEAGLQQHAHAIVHARDLVQVQRAGVGAVGEGGAGADDRRVVERHSEVEKQQHLHQLRGDGADEADLICGCQLRFNRTGGGTFSA